MPISPPEASPKRELARKLFDASLSGVPLVGGPLAAIYSFTYPAKGEVDEAKWRDDVTNLLNSFEEAITYITGSIPLSDDAAFLGKWISESSIDGRSGLFEYDQIVEQFSTASKNEILEATRELELEEMIVVSKCLGKPFNHVRPTHRLFEAFDPIVFPDVSPRADAAIIAAIILDAENGVSAKDLSEELGWGVRRINPALAIVGEFIANCRKSRETGHPYIIPYMFVDGQERAMLRRFINQVAGN